MSRNPIGEKAMTAAERQRRRREKLRTEKPPGKPGRPRFLLDPWLQPEDLRNGANEYYQAFGQKLLGLLQNPYPHDLYRRYRRLKKKGTLEQFGRYGMWLIYVQGLSEEDAAAECRKWADGLLEAEDLNVENVVKFFRWLRKPLRAAAE